MSTVTLGKVPEAIPVSPDDLGYNAAVAGFGAAMDAIPLSKLGRAGQMVARALEVGGNAVALADGATGIAEDGLDWGDGMNIAGGLLGASGTRPTRPGTPTRPGVLGMVDDAAKAPVKTPRPRTNKVQPVEGAGPHTGFKRDPQTGDITGHTTFDENGFITQRTDITGSSHGGVPTPHTHVHGPPNVAPDGRLFPGGEIEVRPALPIEIPKPRGG